VKGKQKNMPTISTRQGQSIYDACMQTYSNVQGLPLLLSGSLSDITDLSAAIEPGTVIVYDPKDLVLKSTTQNSVPHNEVFNVRPWQSIYDLCVQLYGNIESLPLLLNGSLNGDIDLSAVLVAGKKITYDNNDIKVKKPVLKQMDNKIVFTYPNNTYENAEYNFDFNLDFTS
jgi:hypothetical protein